MMQEQLHENVIQNSIPNLPTVLKELQKGLFAYNPFQI